MPWRWSLAEGGEELARAEKALIDKLANRFVKESEQPLERAAADSAKDAARGGAKKAAFDREAELSKLPKRGPRQPTHGRGMYEDGRTFEFDSSKQNKDLIQSNNDRLRARG